MPTWMGFVLGSSIPSKFSHGVMNGLLFMLVGEWAVCTMLQFTDTTIDNGFGTEHDSYNR